MLFARIAGLNFGNAENPQLIDRETLTRVHERVGGKLLDDDRTVTGEPGRQKIPFVNGCFVPAVLAQVDRATSPPNLATTFIARVSSAPCSPRKTGQ